MATDYSDLLIDPVTGNLILTDNSPTLIQSNAESLKQRLWVAFGVWQEEWKFNENFGFPYWELLGKKSAREILDSKVRETVLVPSDVLRLDSFESSFKERQYEAYVTVVTKELEQINIAFFGTQYNYPSPETISNDLCPASRMVTYGAQLYDVINFKLGGN